MISQSQIRRDLGTSSFGKKVYTFETLDSTNNCARALANVGMEEGVLVVSEHQSAGRGRLGRTWESEPGKNLIFSLLLRPGQTIAQSTLLTFFVAVSIAEAVETVTGISPECRWPNDLLLNNKKFCGILLEASMKESATEFVVIGIGINVNQTRFSDELGDKATSLALHLEKDVDRVGLLQECVRRIEKRYLQLPHKGFNDVLKCWKTRCAMVKKTIRVDRNGSHLTGVVKRIDPDGALVLDSDKKEIRLLAGDVTILETL